MGNDGYGCFELSLLQAWQLRCDAHVVHVATRQQRLITALAINGPRPRGYLAGLLTQPILVKDALKAITFAVWQHGAAADELQAKRKAWTVEDLAEIIGTAEPKVAKE